MGKKRTTSRWDSSSSSSSDDEEKEEEDKKKMDIMNNTTDNNNNNHHHQGHGIIKKNNHHKKNQDQNKNNSLMLSSHPMKKKKNNKNDTEKREGDATSVSFKTVVALSSSTSIPPSLSSSFTWNPTTGNDSNSTTRTTNTSSSTSTSANALPWHNPLLQGCRFVYDTYERIARLSEGAYGIVWKAQDLATNEIVALKQIKFDNNDDNQQQQIQQQQQGFPITALREINVLLALSHENIVSVKEMVVGNDMDKVFMVMEFFPLDLKEALDKRKYPNVLPQGELKGIVQQILRGMAYMHSHWYMHRDMKPSNLLVHPTSGRVALCDFGLARRYHNPPIVYTQLVVTLWYRAPELLFGEDQYTPAVDIWSIGCIFGELIQQDAMMQGRGELDQIDKIFSMLGAPTSDNWPDFSSLPSAKMFQWRSTTTSPETIQLRKLFPINPPPHYQQTFLDGNGYDLLSKLLTLNPNTRITAQQALEHPYFQQGVAPTTPNFCEDW